MERIGSLFTNERHRIIYIDEMFKQFIGYTNKQIGQLLGEPIATILNYSADEYESFARAIALSNEANQQIPMTLHLSDAIYQQVLADALANKNHQSIFMGIDYIFYSDARISQQVSTTVPADIERELVRLYCQGQLNSLVNFLIMMSGNKVANYIVNMLQETATKQQWAVSTDNFQIKLADTNSLTADIGLLKKAVAYSYKLLGKAVIVSHIEKQNKDYHAGTFDYLDANWHHQL